MEYLLTLFLFLLVIFLLYYYLSFFTGAPFVATPMKIVKEMVELAAINKNDVVIDLGSGDGRILIEAARKGAKTKGWEINPFLVGWTRLMAVVKGVGPNITVYCSTYQNADLRNADIIMFYNLPKRLPSLEKKLQKELKPGTKVVSYQFPLSKLKLKKQTASGIFLYETHRHSERSGFAGESRNLIPPSSTVA